LFIKALLQAVPALRDRHSPAAGPELAASNDSCHRLAVETMFSSDEREGFQPSSAMIFFGLAQSTAGSPLVVKSL
jgi:hypothetical protein